MEKVLVFYISLKSINHKYTNIYDFKYYFYYSKVNNISVSLYVLHKKITIQVYLFFKLPLLFCVKMIKIIKSY